jgi:tetratricopeptide (TPR) repeat protein
MFDIRRLFAVPLGRRRPRTALDEALAALQARRFADALARLDAILAVESAPAGRAFALNKRGVAQIGLGERAAAEADFREALAAVAEYPGALVNLGNMLLETGAGDDAIAYYRRALTADPDNAGAHFNLGIALKRAGRTGEGVHHLRRAQRLGERRRS